MINEPWFVPQHVGWIEVVCGGMFSGKTEELIRLTRRAQIAGQKVVIVKPVMIIDTVKMNCTNQELATVFDLLPTKNEVRTQNPMI